MLVDKKDEVIKNQKLMISIIFDTTGLEQQKARLEEELNRVADEVNEFIKQLQNQELLKEFNSNVWLSLVDFVEVRHDVKVLFNFLDGSKVELER